MSNRPVDVEVLLLGAADGRLTWDVRRGPLGDGAPDEAALTLAGPDAGPVCHSTSWRTDGSTVVLTYAVLRGDGAPGGAALDQPSVVCSDDPLRPTPAVLHGHHVAAHAVRHLVDLLDRDPVVAGAVQDRPELVALLRAAAAGMPVAPHDDAHRLAAGHQPSVPGAPLNGPTTSSVTQPP